MSLFESASLCVTPNGTKASKLYAIKPTSGAGDLTVTRATTATRVNSTGLIESVAVNVPRLDYTNSTCPSILVEPQRTNTILRSQEFDNAYWTKQNASIVINSTTSPDGTLNASKLVEDTSNSRHYINATNTIVTATQQTASIYIKAAGRTKFALSEEIATGAYASFNLANGTVLDQNGISAKITALTNGWFKCEYTINSTIFFLLRIVLLPNSYTSGGVNGTYTGDGTSGVFLYGTQLEAGSYATSYIPTVASAVTRNADVISKTGISSLIGQTEGTILFDGKINGCENPSANLINTEKNVITSFAISYIKATKKIQCSIFDNSVEKGVISGGTFEIGDRFRVAYAYKSGNFALYINGNLIGTSASSFTFPNTLDDIFIGDVGTYFAYQESISNNTSALWKTRLTNAELAELTTI